MTHFLHVQHAKPSTLTIAALTIAALTIASAVQYVVRDATPAVFLLVTHSAAVGFSRQAIYQQR